MISDEQLNALIDGQLQADEQAELLKLISTDENLAARYFDLKQVDELVKSGFFDLAGLSMQKRRTPHRNYLLVASFLLTVFSGALAGRLFYPPQSQEQLFTTIQRVEQDIARHKKVLFHVRSMDKNHIQRILAATDKLLRARPPGLTVEVIANAEGLGLLRIGSPYRKKIVNLTSQYKNVRFLACGIARQNARLKEHRPIELIQEATPIPAALDRILSRMQAGWIYVKD